MSRIKTLSEDIDVSVSTSYLVGQSGASGYVITKIYENMIGVFSGQSYVTEGTDLIVNINDIASQNDYKKDYLKLQNNGELVSDPMIYNMIGTNNVRYRFNRGAISTYKVRLDGNDNTSETNIDVLCGYDYVNADLQPRCVQDLPQYAWDTSLCRLMTGCQWIWIPDDDMGSFTNIPDDNDALPHYPFKYTNKYGIGLSLNHPGDYSRAAYCNTEFAIRLTTGNDFLLGMTPFVSSNTTFTTLNNFLEYLNNDEDYDSNNIYLKLYGTSGDAFGDWEEGYTKYKRQEALLSLTVYLERGEGQSRTQTISRTNDSFRTYAQRYIDKTDVDWNITDIIDGENIVFDSGWRSRESDASALGEDYKNHYTYEDVPLTTAEIMFGYTLTRITPVYRDIDETEDVPDKYIGNCIVGVFDKCPARYYLAWNDRYGDIQSQPFDGKILYSEDIKSEEIVDYKLRRRVSHKSIQPKWKLNTKWLKEDVYPIYETIFTSPYVLLYDTEQDKAWNVIVTDNKYEEKKYKYDKMFNLEISVEAIKTQELTY